MKIWRRRMRRPQSALSTPLLALHWRRIPRSGTGTFGHPRALWLKLAKRQLGSSKEARAMGFAEDSGRQYGVDYLMPLE